MLELTPEEVELVRYWLQCWHINVLLPDAPLHVAEEVEEEGRRHKVVNVGASELGLYVFLHSDGTVAANHSIRQMCVANGKTDPMAFREERAARAKRAEEAERRSAAAKKAAATKRKREKQALPYEPRYCAFTALDDFKGIFAGAERYGKYDDKPDKLHPLDREYLYDGRLSWR